MPQETLAPGSARAAADRLRDALERHLSAVESRRSEHDPDVQRAYVELRTAAADYDLALYQEHDEVTPFDLPERGAADDAPREVSLERLSLVARWDFTVDDADVLIEAAEKAVGDEVEDEAIALAALVAAVGHSRLAASAASVGLRAHGHTTWVLATDDADPDDDDPAWMDDAFGGAEADLALVRLESPVEQQAD
jgi:hypothetical protein